MSLRDYKNLKTLTAVQNGDNGKTLGLIFSPFTGFPWGEEPEEALDRLSISEGNCYLLSSTHQITSLPFLFFNTENLRKDMEKMRGRFV